MNISLRSTLAAFGLSAALLGTGAQAFPVVPIVTGSTVIVSAPPAVATISYAVISGTDFLAQGFPLAGGVAGGTLDVLGGGGVAATDFVYMYQTVNTGIDPIVAYDVFLGAATGTLTGGGRLESTIFVEPGVGKVSLGPLGSTSGLSAGLPLLDWATFAPTPCLGSGGGNECSDGTTDLLPASVTMYGFGETPSTVFIDPGWTSSIMWFSTPLAPTLTTATQTFLSFIPGAGLVAGVGVVPIPAAVWLFGSALAGLGWIGRKQAA
jgi:hypothetical protein